MSSGPKVLVLSDSLAEAMGNTGPIPAWLCRLFPQQRVYIPAHSTWANGDNTWDASILGGGAVVNAYLLATRAPRSTSITCR